MSNVITIDSSKKFNPAEVLGRGWSIAEEDEKSLAVTEIDLNTVRLEHMLQPGEEWIKGEEKLTRLKDAGFVRFDARIFETLWENKHLIPERWKEDTNRQTTFIFFDGTVLRDPDGDRCVLCLYWRGSRWSWNCLWLGDGWGVRGPSAVLVS